jgi:putative addiction module component (TIGR02574 family)
VLRYLSWTTLWAVTMNENLRKELFNLSPAERIQLAEELWDSVAAEPENLPPLTPEQIEEIERRLAEHERDPGRAMPWEEVRQRIWSRFK